MTAVCWMGKNRRRISIENYRRPEYLLSGIILLSLTGTNPIRKDGIGQIDPIPRILYSCPPTLWSRASAYERDDSEVCIVIRFSGFESHLNTHRRLPHVHWLIYLILFLMQGQRPEHAHQESRQVLGGEANVCARYPFPPERGV